MNFYNDDFSILNSMDFPKDLKNVKNLNELCSEIRKKIIDVVSKNGGHLAPNLGVVELTVALHKIFNDDEDKIIWDVGHQSYTHKILTGRYSKMDTLRQKDGISGFMNRNESEYDAFTSGHSSTSISAALGLANSKKIFNEKGHVVVVIGDGALTGGLAYEGLNNAGRFNKNFIIILNDNKMSISKNVGAMARYLSIARVKPVYMKAKNALEKVLDKTKIGLKIKDLMKWSKTTVKKVICQGNIFEDMGFTYYGPVDGHNLEELQNALNIAKNLNKPSVIHIITTKGKGYKFAEENPKIYHCVPPFDVEKGISLNKNNKNFSKEFGKTMCEIANAEPRLCAITAAMTSGTGLAEFRSKYKSRFFDVGIAEGHAVTFAGGLATGGLIPVFAVYSSFLQRAYDQIIHDVSLQNLKIVFAIDRAGFVGNDGETHHGIFDVPFLNTIPNVTIYAPSFLEELKPMLENAIYVSPKISAVRYPKGNGFKKIEEFEYTGNDFDFYGDENSDFLVITYGRIFSNAYFATKEVNKDICLLKLNIIKPIDILCVKKSINFKKIIFFEESLKSGGVAEKFSTLLINLGYKGEYKINAVNDEFVKHATIDEQLNQYNLDIIGMKKVIEKFFY